MKKFLLAVPVALTLATVPMASEAKGCLKGAVVGGVAGHLAKNHGVLGAAAGCAIGTHQANKKEREAAANTQVATNQAATPATEQPVKKKHFWSKS
jgi:hypothetical protein